MVRALVVLAIGCCLPAAHAAGDEAGDEVRARELGRVLGLDVQLERILHGPRPATTDEALAQVDAIERVMVSLSRAGLDVDATRARLQHEEFEAKNTHDLIEAHHEDTVARWNIAAVLVGNGISIVGSGMQFGNDTVAKWGDGVIIGGAVLAAAFGVVALVKRDVGKLPAAIDTNLLAPLFDRPATAHSRYPAWIWRYLDEPRAGAAGSIRAELLDKWTREGRLKRGDFAFNERRVRLLCEPLRAARRIDADTLDDRADMLADVRERVSGLSVDLDLLWQKLHARP